jgi:hypothetical protein
MPKLKALIVMLVAVCLASPALAGGNANFLLGLRSLDNDFEPVEDQNALGVTVDFGVSDWPINLEVGAHISSEEDSIRIGGSSIDVDVTITELTFGVVKIWEVGGGNVHPFVGGGLTAYMADIKVEGEKTDDTAPGLYAHGGVFWRLGEAFNIGVDGRIVQGVDLDFEGDSVDGNYLQTSLILGWGWD